MLSFFAMSIYLDDFQLIISFIEKLMNFFNFFIEY